VSQIHLGHVFHLAGSPLITEAAAALVSISDGALVFDDGGHITFCGDRTEIPPEHGSATVFDHRPGFLLPGFVDTHVHFPQTDTGDVDTALLHVATVPRFALGYGSRHPTSTRTTGPAPARCWRPGADNIKAASKRPWSPGRRSPRPPPAGRQSPRRRGDSWTPSTRQEVAAANPSTAGSRNTASSQSSW
jgi:hypothetical protein